VTSSIPYHVEAAEKAGAWREEVSSAVLVGLPVAGHVVTQALPVAVEAYDAE
jgi:alkylhydroperoxidase/carboxymuconolactone decarboxylase family protein YurZ